MNEQEQLEESRARVIEVISQNMGLYGVTPSIGRLYCLLFFSEKPLTLDEMKEELGMSKASMSNAVRALLDLNMVEKTWVKGVRKDLYVASDNPHQRFFDYFTTKWRHATMTNTNAIEKTTDELKNLLDDPDTSEEVKAKAEVDVAKLKDWQEYYDWLDRLIHTFETKEILDFVPLHKEEQEKR
ncbi:GbsR/MarR family transcriptional regulator [Halobacillus salinus]|uniref:HTH-type transcriptional regulator n=1 Tax=Halobacillus salinus TaxID=192814 RepID=A0A4Z0GXZ3_9BACI|nr:GbsR/MarR family transcriptional regulator [Halobacillus salinus]TGB01449.1 GbsR/MarR family transcriptional regulator [Halobacillus salinus]